MDNWSQINLDAPQLDTQLSTPTFNQRDYLGDVAGASGNQAAARAQQQTLADMLMQRAQGQGPSIAEMQLQQTLDANKRAAAGAIAGVRGMNPALAQRLLLNQQAGMSQQAAGQGALLRAQEMLAAQQALGGQLQAQRGQDITQYGQAGTIGLNQSQLGVDAQLRAQQQQLMKDQENARLQQESQKLQAEQKAADEKMRKDILFGAGGQDKGMLGGLIESGGKALITAGLYKGGQVNPALDKPENDIVHAKLSPGEIVLPRSVVATNDPEKAKAFVSAIMKRKSPDEAKKEAAKADEKPTLKKIKELEARLKKLESKK